MSAEFCSSGSLYSYKYEGNRKTFCDTQHTTHLPFIEKNYLNIITTLPKWIKIKNKSPVVEYWNQWNCQEGMAVSFEGGLEGRGWLQWGVKPFCEEKQTFLN